MTTRGARRLARAAVVAWTTVVATLAARAALPAQDPSAGLDTAARGFARAWQAGRVDLLAERLDEEGVRLHLPEGSHPTLPVRLARAALEDLHRGVGAGPVVVRQVRLLGGDPARGFFEMTWTPHPSGTSEALAFTVFTGLERREATWRVVEVRVLPRNGGRGPPGLPDRLPSG